VLHAMYLVPRTTERQARRPAPKTIPALRSMRAEDSGVQAVEVRLTVPNFSGRGSGRLFQSLHGPGGPSRRLRLCAVA
jgi:hypothetical protein